MDLKEYNSAQDCIIRLQYSTHLPDGEQFWVNILQIAPGDIYACHFGKGRHLMHMGNLGQLEPIHPDIKEISSLN